MLHMLPVQIYATVQETGGEHSASFTLPTVHITAWDTGKEAVTTDRSESEIWQTLVFRKQLYYIIMSLFSFCKKC